MNTTLRSGTPEEASISPSRLRRVSNFAQELADQGTDYQAIVTIVARSGVIVLQEAFGKLRPGPDLSSVELDSIFILSSLSKPIVATLAMILLEDGLLSLNHTVEEYIPEFVGEGKDKIMIHHLLTHTTGLITADVNEHAEKKKGNVEIPPSDEMQHPELNEYLFLRYDAPLSRPPGEVMTYSGFSYALMGEIVRRVSGKSLDDFARERLFGPLGMNDSYYETPDSVRHRMVEYPAYRFPHIDFCIRLPIASVGVISTAVDMAIFGQMFLNGGVYGDARILSPASVAQMTRNQIPGIPWRYGEESGPEGNWGYGWAVHNAGLFYTAAPVLCSDRMFWHTGSGRVHLWVDPVYEIVGCFFSVCLKESGTMREIAMFIDMVTAGVVDI